MAKRSTIATLPEAVRDELNKLLIANAFSGYTAITAWLVEQGFDVSRSAVHRYGSDFERTLERVRLATLKAAELVKHFPDDDTKLATATVRMVQARLYEAMEDEDLDPVSLAKVSRAIADITRADIAQRLRLEEMRERTKKALKDMEKSVKSGASKEALLQEIKTIFGLFDDRPASHAR